jgi:hypothetical protein
VRRREFITLIGGAAAAWPLAAWAQGERVRIGILMSQAADDPEGQPRLLALAQGLQESGWTVGRNVRIDTRWGAGDAERYRRYSAELVALAPDVILVNGPSALAQLQQTTRSVPAVFVNVTDPVGAGFVESLSRPGGNATGFMLSEYSTKGSDGAGDDRKMNNEPLESEPTNNEPLEREPIDRMRARLEALLKANAAPRCGARSKRTGKPCRGAAMPNGRCKVHGGKSTGPRTPEGLERSRRANWKHGHFSREAKAQRSRVRAAILAVRYLRDSI